MCSTNCCATARSPTNRGAGWNATSIWKRPQSWRGAKATRRCDRPPPDDFYASLPLLSRLYRGDGPGLFSPLPVDWVVGIADVVQSTKAIAENRYKAVNMAGAAVIVAVTNALQDRDFPFVFGGDGASFAVPARGRGGGTSGARRDRDLGAGGPRPHACASAWCRSRTFARRASMSASPAMRRRTTSRSRCSPAAAWPGPTPP